MKMYYDDYADEPIRIKSIIDVEDNKITTYCNDHKLDHGTRDSIFGHILTQNLYGISVRKFLVSENPVYTMEGNIDAKFSFGNDIVAYRVASFCNSALRIVTVQYDKEEDMSIFALYDVNREGSYIAYFDDKKQTGNIIYKMKDTMPPLTQMYFRYYGNPLDMCWIPIEIKEWNQKLVFKDDKKNMCMVKKGNDMYGIKVINKDGPNTHLAYIPFIPIEVLGGTITIFKDENFWDVDNHLKMAVTYTYDEDKYLSSMDQITIEVMRYEKLSLLLRRDINEKQSSSSC